MPLYGSYGANFNTYKSSFCDLKLNNIKYTLFVKMDLTSIGNQWEQLRQMLHLNSVAVMKY